MWEKACLFGSCFGRKHFSSIENTCNLLLLSVGTNAIIMPSRFLYKEHVGVWWVMMGWGGSWWGEVGHVGMGWSGSCRGGQVM